MLTRSVVAGGEAATHSIACPGGFLAGGTACGIKPSGADDLAMVLCPRAASAAAVFTRNLVCAAPVTMSREHLRRSGGRVRAIIINSGCANAATGEEGMRRARAVTEALAGQLGCPVEQVLMNSTGVIGESLPDDLIRGSLAPLATSCTADGLGRVATAIMTTDTRPKLAERSIATPGDGACRVVGVAKGAGMIHPDMATMIAVIMTDAAVEPADLDRLLRGAVDRSFHRITVDGDTSTNDAVFLLASGEAGDVAEEELAGAIDGVARELAEMIVRDGEGATRLIRVRVSGAADGDEALLVARTVASSLLVRTSVAGGDPNWGRILAAAGRSGAPIEPEKVTLHVNELPLYSDGRPAGTPRAQLQAAYLADEVVLDIDLARGDARDEFLTCDLTEHYVRINAEYTS